ncbi:hypothetical protein AACH06_00870 [Ideonella sp. DXS29W]|uniref:Type III secretion protein HrpB7 n=1 Tax=Ideonella lacteola TaxID=2984193 RepID=A0ABU9BI27_9BURK
MSNIRSWRALTRIKERRLAQQDEAVQAARNDLAACQAAQEEAEQVESERRADWQRARERVLGLLDGEEAFKPDLLMARGRQVDDCVQALRRAEDDTERHRQRVRVAEHELQMALAQRQRLDQQLQLAREALDKALACREQADQDQQDEDAEETAVARLLAAARASAGEARGTRV